MTTRRPTSQMPGADRLVAYIREHTARTGWPPSRREMAEALGVNVSTAQKMLVKAEADGLVERNPEGARQIRLTPEADRLLQMKQITPRKGQMK